jgi:tRNA1(Val) A37 N6-methylase TrmN6
VIMNPPFHDGGSRTGASARRSSAVLTPSCAVAASCTSSPTATCPTRPCSRPYSPR